MQILVREVGGAAVDRAEDVERVVDERRLEAPPLSALRLRSSSDQRAASSARSRNGCGSRDPHREPSQQRRHDGRLVGPRVPERRPRPAALAEERPLLVVAREEPHRAGTVPALERVRLVVGLEMRGRIQLEDGIPGRDDERARRVDRLLELERTTTAHSATISAAPPASRLVPPLDGERAECALPAVADGFDGVVDRHRLGQTRGIGRRASLRGGRQALARRPPHGQAASSRAGSSRSCSSSWAKSRGRTSTSASRAPANATAAPTSRMSFRPETNASREASARKL